MAAGIEKGAEPKGSSSGGPQLWFCDGDASVFSSFGSIGCPCVPGDTVLTDAGLDRPRLSKAVIYPVRIGNGGKPCSVKPQ